MRGPLTGPPLRVLILAAPGDGVAGWRASYAATLHGQGVDVTDATEAVQAAYATDGIQGVTPALTSCLRGATVTLLTPPVGARHLVASIARGECVAVIPRQAAGTTPTASPGGSAQNTSGLPRERYGRTTRPARNPRPGWR